MAKKIYVGVNGKARKVRKMYVGVGGSAHKVKKGYIGVNGVARLFFTSGKPLSQYAEGAIIKINEGGKPAEFYVAKHNYESSLNGNGRTLVVRKEAGVKKQFHSKTFDVQYSGSDIDNWLINDYKNSLDPGVQSVLGSTKNKRTSTADRNDILTDSRPVFLLSLRERGHTDSSANNYEGSPLPNISLYQQGYYNGAKDSIWTRTIHRISDRYVFFINEYGNPEDNYPTSSLGVCPAFTLPETLLLNEQTNQIIG